MRKGESCIIITSNQHIYVFWTARLYVVANIREKEAQKSPSNAHITRATRTFRARCKNKIDGARDRGRTYEWRRATHWLGVAGRRGAVATALTRNISGGSNTLCDYGRENKTTRIEIASHVETLAREEIDFFEILRAIPRMVTRHKREPT